MSQSAPNFSVWWVDLAMAIAIVELLVLAVYRRLSGQGLPPRQFVLGLLSGLCLMAALRCGLAGSGAGWMLLFFAGSGLIHCGDLWLRWPRR